MHEVRIRWIDSGTFRAADEWTKEDTLKSESKIGAVTTRGALLQVTPNSVLVGLSEDPEGRAWFGVQEIDRRAIVGVEIFRVRKSIEPSELDDLGVI